MSGTLEIGHKEWLLRLQTLHTFEKETKRQKKLKDKKRQKDKETKRQKGKTTKRQKRQKGRKTKILWCQGSFACGIH